jgi:hypothetical protein
MVIIEHWCKVYVGVGNWREELAGVSRAVQIQLVKENTGKFKHLLLVQ